ncbi:MerR family transcriptional regulator [Streptomyces sp. ITFR-16]|uniref:MerR family transcriptional regulator n=1 Tax=Streptomyces sp. ITFR-16 TaxID=3075198 RepID=UPI002889DDFA|nr:MerR family transcriptional regulator [Streptomyces sp. ITFR-16]WNI20948.1 MerR family transcriptional regulator [Streptomyces sp. ITFR-16]
MNGDTHDGASGGTRLSIGELARRTGLSVKTVRFYSDRGIVPPADRSPAGYRQYDPDAVARLNLVRTLRELGLGLSTIGDVVAGQARLSDVAAAHAEALETRIRTLSLRRAVLTAVARRGSTPEEMELMHRLARLSEDQRRTLTRDFLDAVFGSPPGDPGLDGVLRSMTPELPDDPADDQVEAWAELAELTQDPEFRAALRRSAEHHTADRAAGGGSVPVRDPEAVIRDHAAAPAAAGTDPLAPQADGVVDAVTASYARLCGLPDDTALRRRLLARLDSGDDPRRERYFQLLAVINRWPAPEPVAPALDWFRRALRARTAG